MSTSFKPEVVVCDSAEQMSERAYDILTAAVESSSGGLSVGLSGGSTPKALYTLLHDRYLNALVEKKVLFFFGDERLVPLKDERSNFHMAHAALLRGVPASQVLPIDPTEALPTSESEAGGAEGAARAAAVYEAALLERLPHSTEVECGSGKVRVPIADVVLLGFGSDGHTASIFPGSIASGEAGRAVTVAFPSPTMSPKVWRVSVSKTFIQQARHVIVLAGGADKAWVVRGVLADQCPASGDAIPVSRFLRECTGKVTFIVDKASSNL